MSDDTSVRISHDTLRLGIGFLGVTLPLAVLFGGGAIQPSISDYYYSTMRDYFEGVLFFLAMFLFAYRPYGADGWKDRWITNLAGLCALVVALFPTVNAVIGHVPVGIVLNFIPVGWSGTVHLAGAGSLFACFAVLSLFFFTKGSKPDQTTRKQWRNRIYIACGLGIVFCLGFIVWAVATAPDQTARDNLNVLVPESTALILFGLSWLVKGGLFLKDKRAQVA